MRYCQLIQLRRLSSGLTSKKSLKEVSWEDCQKEISLAKAYKPELVEPGRYESWEHQGLFNPSDPSKMPFSMILPPPNVTGTLHLGHTLIVTIQDVLARWERMKGSSVVWVPGTDHAGIATQAVVERTLARIRPAETKLSQQELLEEILRWKEEKGNVILTQLKNLGASLDWSRQYFTLDKSRSEAVTSALVTLWDQGLIYRGESLTNWSIALGSAISDIEVDHVSVEKPTKLRVPGYPEPVTFGQMVYFAYPVDNQSAELVVGSTRLETMLGDVAVAVHPEDSRYTHLHGTNLRHPFTNRLLPVITDYSVNPSLGSGAVKVTPAHSPIDFELARSHNLPLVSVIDEQGRIVSGFKSFSGKRRFDARTALITSLSDLGLLRDVTAHAMRIPICSRSGDVIEFLLKPQWFIKCSEMATKAKNAVESGELEIIPEVHKESWLHWMNNIRDWCISRQLIWGHQLPLYQVSDSKSMYWIAALSPQEAHDKALKLVGSTDFTLDQDQDVLDTWFSSALLPRSVFSSSDAQEPCPWYPLSVMATGHDIMFFWVARMVMMSLQLHGQLPFKKVFLHGVLCDSQGRKMSKSLGNVIDPSHIVNGISLQELKKDVDGRVSKGILSPEEGKIAKTNFNKEFPKGMTACGTDALRFTLLTHNLKNHFINFDIKECNANRLFCNKIWQATRFALGWTSRFDVTINSGIHVDDLSLIDEWILDRLNDTLTNLEDNLASFDFHLAAISLKTFFYSELCDVYLEAIKPVLAENNAKARNSCAVLVHCLDLGLRALAPIMPYLSDVLYQALPGSTSSVHVASYPIPFKEPNLELATKINVVLDLVSEIRRLKFEHKIKDCKVMLVGESNLRDVLDLIRTLARESCIELSTVLPTEGFLSKSVIHSITVLVSGSTQDTNNSQNDNSLIEKRISKLKNQLEKLHQMIAHPNYSTNASDSAKSSHRDKILRLEAELEKLRRI